MSFIAVGAAAIAVGGTIAASSIQASAAKKAARTQARSADEAINLQREIYQQQREDIGPWRQAGLRGLSQFEALARQGPPQMRPFTAPQALDPSAYAFTPPTEADLRQDPSYQFRLAEGQRAIERGASARGGLLSGGALRGLERYAQDYASTEYGNVYGRKLGENQLRYGRDLAENESAYSRALQQYQTRYNVGLGQYQARLAPWQTLAYGGQQASTTLGQLGQNYANQSGEILQGQGNALAAGQLQSAQAWAQGISNISNIAQQGLQNYYLGAIPRPQTPTQGLGSLPYA